MVNSSFLLQGRHEIEICLVGLVAPTPDLLKDSEDLNPKYLRRGLQGCCVPIGAPPVESILKTSRARLDLNREFPWKVRRALSFSSMITDLIL